MKLKIYLNSPSEGIELSSIFTSISSDRRLATEETRCSETSCLSISIPFFFFFDRSDKLEGVFLGVA